jgi:hypothetical protein
MRRELMSEPILGDFVRGDQDLDAQMGCNMESIDCARHLMAVGLHRIEILGIQMESNDRI